MQAVDYYELSNFQRELIKGISIQDISIVKQSLEDGAVPQILVDIYMITGSGNRIFMERFSMMSLALKYKNLEILKLLVLHGAKIDEYFLELLNTIEPGEDEDIRNYAKTLRL